MTPPARHAGHEHPDKTDSMEPLEGQAAFQRAGGPVAGAGSWLLSRDFALLWWSQMISQVGDAVTKLALLWFVYAVTGSALKTTVIGLLQTLPPILLGPLIGVYVDRWPKKVLMIGSDVVRAVVIGAIPCLVSVDAFTVERLYTLVFLQSLASAVFGPAMTASVPFLVARPQFTAANALLQGTTSVGVIVGPAMSGVGIAVWGAQEVLCVNAVTYLGSAVCLVPLFLPRARLGEAEQGPARTLLVDLLEGARFALVRQPRILLLILTASLYTFGTAAFSTLLPVFGKQLLHLGPVEIGYLWSGFGAGLLVMSIGLVAMSDWELRSRFFVIAASSALSGVALGGLLAVRTSAPAVLLMGLIGIGTGALTPIAWSALQEISPARMVGRVLALYTTCAMATAIAGMSVFGWITERYGGWTGVSGIALVMLAVACLALGLSRWVRVRTLGPHRRPANAADDYNTYRS